LIAGIDWLLLSSLANLNVLKPNTMGTRNFTLNKAYNGLTSNNINI